MEYRAVGNRCAVNLQSLNLPVTDTEALEILQSKGFVIREVNLAVLARQCIEKSKYRRGASLAEAPAVVDCSGFVKWLYGQKGIWLPRRSIQQREVGVSVALDEIVEGDVVFTSGYIDYYLNDSRDGVGHVGMFTEQGTVVHSAGKSAGVTETPLSKFVGKTEFRGARRYVPKDGVVITLETPASRGVEISDDIRWIVLQSLSKS